MVGIRRENDLLKKKEKIFYGTLKQVREEKEYKMPNIKDKMKILKL